MKKIKIISVKLTAVGREKRFRMRPVQVTAPSRVRGSRVHTTLRVIVSTRRNGYIVAENSITVSESAWSVPGGVRRVKSAATVRLIDTRLSIGNPSAITHVVLCFFARSMSSDEATRWTRLTGGGRARVYH